MKEFQKLNFKTFTNRGFNLTPVEFKDLIPFEVKRMYFIDALKTGDQTGEHCHYAEEEFFMVAKGSVTAIIDQGNGKEDVRLVGPSEALYVPNYVWHGFKEASEDCVIIALSSTNYSPDRSDYQENYDEYLKVRDQGLADNLNTVALQRDQSRVSKDITRHDSVESDTISTNRMPSVLILGAKGMLGQALEAEFSGAGWMVTGYDREELDVTDFEAVTQKLAELKPDLVINSVAINAVDKIETEPDFLEAAETINSRVPGKLAELCKTRAITLVHYSSDYVFAGDNENGYAEDVVLAPLNKYGQTKAAGEIAVQNVGGKYYVIRLSKLFGKPAVSEGAKKSFVDTMLGLAVGGKKEFDVVDDESSSPTYAPDLAHFTRELVESNKDFGIYHGANSGACTWYEWAKEIFALKNISVEVRSVPATAYPRPAARPHTSTLLSTKIQVQRSWQEALQEYLASN